eukprot:scaffold82500_cov29-Tisochrysis_lutea.AAC.7
MSRPSPLRSAHAFNRLACSCQESTPATAPVGVALQQLQHACNRLVAQLLQIRAFVVLTITGCWLHALP